MKKYLLRDLVISILTLSRTCGGYAKSGTPFWAWVLPVEDPIAPVRFQGSIGLNKEWIKSVPAEVLLELLLFVIVEAVISTSYKPPFLGCC